MDVIKSIPRSVSTSTAQCKCLLLFFVFGLVIVYYTQSDSVISGSQNAVVLNIWHPKDHNKRNFPSASLRASEAAVAAKAATKDQMIIYIYPPPEMISDAIRTGAWEPHKINRLISYLLKDKELNLIDIGTMVGLYTLQAANIGRKVVGVDGNAENLWRLGQSLLENQLDKQVTLLHNIIDATHGPRYMHVIPSHVGASYVGKELSKGQKLPAVPAITADDLLPVIPFKRAVMKVDIENHEYQMLQSASKLFEKVDIPFVMMEYNGPRRTRKARNFIRNFMTSRNYFAYADIDSNVVLGTDDTKWPFDIVWRKNDALSEYRS